MTEIILQLGDDVYEIPFAGIQGPPGVDGDGAGGGAATFLELTDTPESYTASRLLAVNGDGDGIIFPSDSASRTLLGLGSAALNDTGDFATAAQGALADTAVQPDDLAAVATSGAYGDLSGLPSLFDGAYSSLSGIPSTFAPSAHTVESHSNVTGSMATNTHLRSDGTNWIIAEFLVDVQWAVAQISVGTLDDVTIFEPSAGQTLRWNGTQFVNAALGYSDLSGIPSEFAPSAHTHAASEVTDFNAAADARADARISAASIGDLDDVNLSGLASGKILEYDGSAFVLIDTPSGGGGSSTLGGLSDVTLSSPSSAQVLRHDGSGWVNATLEYSDLTGTPSLAAVATSGDYDDLDNLPSLFDGAYASLSGIPSTFAPAAHNLTSHSDVTITLAANGDALFFGGTVWVNRPIAAGDIKSGQFDLGRMPTSVQALPELGGEFLSDAALTTSEKPIYRRVHQASNITLAQIALPDGAEDIEITMEYFVGSSAGVTRAITATVGNFLTVGTGGIPVAQINITDLAVAVGGWLKFTITSAPSTATQAIVTLVGVRT